MDADALFATWHSANVMAGLGLAAVTPRWLSTFGKRTSALSRLSGGAIDASDKSMYVDWWTLKVAGWRAWWARSSTRHAEEGLQVMSRVLQEDDDAQEQFEDMLEEAETSKGAVNPRLPNLRDESGKPCHRRQRGNKVAAIRHYSTMVRNKFGAIPDTPVNRRVAWETAYKMMKLASWRDRDIAKILPYVVEMAFVPTLDEERATFARTAGVGAETQARLRLVPHLRV